MILSRNLYSTRQVAAVVSVLLALSLWTTAGCGSQGPLGDRPETSSTGAAPTGNAANHPGDSGHDHTGHDDGHEHSHADHDAESGDEAEIKLQLAKLSDADRSAAERQRLCPVSGEPLGSMGVPPKIQVEGQDVFLCCMGCAEEIKKDPQQYLGKLHR
jgi:hypothetical protein